MSLPPQSVGGFTHAGHWTQTAPDAPMTQAPSQGIVTEAVRALNAATIGASSGDRGRGSRARHGSAEPGHGPRHGRERSPNRDGRAPSRSVSRTRPAGVQESLDWRQALEMVTE